MPDRECRQCGAVGRWTVNADHDSVVCAACGAVNAEVEWFPNVGVADA